MRRNAFVDFQTTTAAVNNQLYGYGSLPSQGRGRERRSRFANRYHTSLASAVYSAEQNVPPW
jgi:hypothetical protein